MQYIIAQKKIKTIYTIGRLSLAESRIIILEITEFL